MPIPNDRKARIEARRFQALNRAAPYRAAITPVAVLASFAFLPPQAMPLLLSALSGLVLAIYPAFRNVFAHHSALTRRMLQLAGTGGFIILINKARDGHVAAGLDMSKYAGGLLIVQSLGMALLTASVLLLYTRHFPVAINEE